MSTHQNERGSTSRWAENIWLRQGRDIYRARTPEYLYMCGVAVSGFNSRFIRFFFFFHFQFQFFALPSRLAFTLQFSYTAAHTPNTFLSIFSVWFFFFFRSFWSSASSSSPFLIQYSARFTHSVHSMLYISMAMVCSCRIVTCIILSQTVGTKRPMFRHTCVNVDARPRFFFIFISFFLLLI